MSQLPPAHHETSKRDSPNETKVKEKQNKTIPDSNSNLAKSMTHHNQIKKLTTWFLSIHNNDTSETNIDRLQEWAREHTSQEGCQTFVRDCFDLQWIYCKLNWNSLVSSMFMYFSLWGWKSFTKMFEYLFTDTVQPESPAKLGRSDTEEAEASASVESDLSEGMATEMIEPSEVRPESDPWKD
jgi:hypothetical protein